VLLLGESMGGSATLLLSALATKVLAFTPQVDFSTSLLRPCCSADGSSERAFRDQIQAAIQASSASIDIHSGSWENDLNQARLAGNFAPNVQVFEHPIDDHLLAKVLSDAGSLVSLLATAIRDEVQAATGIVTPTNSSDGAPLVTNDTATNIGQEDNTTSEADVFGDSSDVFASPTSTTPDGILTSPLRLDVAADEPMDEPSMDAQQAKLFQNVRATFTFGTPPDSAIWRALLLTEFHGGKARGILEKYSSSNVGNRKCDDNRMWDGFLEAHPYPKRVIYGHLATGHHKHCG